MAYRWFCQLGLEDKVPDLSTFSKNRHVRFRQRETSRHVFETVLRRCMTERLVGGQGFHQRLYNILHISRSADPDGRVKLLHLSRVRRVDIDRFPSIAYWALDTVVRLFGSSIDTKMTG